MNDKFFDELKEKVKFNFEKGGSHEFSHVERVYRLAIKIGKKEKADLDILKAAALLHDIARGNEERGEIECHAETGAEIARKILERTDFPKEKIKSVANCIKIHRYKKNLKAETKEEKILQDADRLDALGAISIGRIFSYGGKHGRPLYNPLTPPKSYYASNAKTSINHFYEKIFKIKPETFNTQSAKKIAKHRYNFVKGFVKEFLFEWEGKA